MGIAIHPVRDKALLALQLDRGVVLAVLDRDHPAQPAFARRIGQHIQQGPAHALPAPVAADRNRDFAGIERIVTSQHRMAHHHARRGVERDEAFGAEMVHFHHRGQDLVIQMLVRRQEPEAAILVAHAVEELLQQRLVLRSHRTDRQRGTRTGLEFLGLRSENNLIGRHGVPPWLRSLVSRCSIAVLDLAQNATAWRNSCCSGRSCLHSREIRLRAAASPDCPVKRRKPEGPRNGADQPAIG